MGSLMLSASQAMDSAGILVSRMMSWAFCSSLDRPDRKAGVTCSIDLHIAYRQGHISLFVGDEQVGGGGRTRYRQALADVDAQLSAAGGNTLGVHIVPKGGEHPHIHPQQRQVVGDVSPHASQAHADLAGVGICGHQGPVGPAPDVDVHAAHHHRVGGGADDISLAGDMSLLHQVGDVHRRRRAGDPRLVRQLLLGDEGIFLDPSEDLPFPLGHGIAS